MQTSNRHTPDKTTDQVVLHSRDSSANYAGLFFILTAVATLIAVITRVSANADQPTLAESLSAISENRTLYGAGGIARFVSGITLLIGGWLLLRSWLIRERFDSPFFPGFLALSGVLTAVSGACAIALAVLAPTTGTIGAIGAPTEFVALLRWLLGKSGFTVAGLAILLTARHQWKAGVPLKKIAPVSAVIGIAMQFIWWDAATIVHRITGIAFLLWLVLIGFILITGRTERHFIRKADAATRT